MKIIRQKFFSDDKKDEKTKDILKSGALGLGAIGVYKGGETLGNLANLKSNLKAIEGSANVSYDFKNLEKNKEVAKKLIDKAKKLGINLTSNPDLPDAYNPKTNTINLKPGITATPGGLAHELGHSSYYRKGDGGIIGRISHRIDVPGRILNAGLDAKKNFIRRGIKSGIMLPGFINGYESVERKDDGSVGMKDHALLRSVGSAALSTAPLIPVLTSEALATKKGLKYLKKAGASEKLLKDTKKELGACFGTYASQTLRTGGLGLAGHAVGMGTKYAEEALKKDKNKK